MTSKLFMGSLFACIALVISGCGAQDDAAGPAEPEFSITNVSGDLYQASTPSHNTVFLVTPDGVILGDPLREDFAEWLKAELATRFNASVEYVLYSHHHPDHAAGGNVFADTATYVGHENMASLLEGLPSNAVDLDANGNGSIDRSEAAGPYGMGFAQLDTDQNDALSGAEINAATHPLDVTYTDHMSVTLGGSTVEMYYSPPAHSPDMAVLLFPEQRALFAVDFLHVTRFPGNLAGAPVASYEAALEALEALDFDILMQGHSNVTGTKSDVASFLTFLRALESEVAAAIAAGSSVEEAQETILMSEYADWLLYDARRTNLIGEMYGILAE